MKIKTPVKVVSAAIFDADEKRIAHAEIASALNSRDALVKERDELREALEWLKREISFDRMALDVIDQALSRKEATK